jgi:hypothetical protein
LPRRLVWGLALSAALCARAAPGAAGPHSEVASAFDDEDAFDLHVRLDYEYQLRRSSVHRERVGRDPAGAGDPVPVGPDLVFSSDRHLLVPRAELGIFHDLAITAALPIVIVDSRRLELDQRNRPCGPGDCVDRASSTTILDGLLPADGFDARDPRTNFPGDGALIFRGPDRGGLDQLHLGVVWAPMNQARDETKPTWKLGAELRRSIGRIARLDPIDPRREDGISSGVHEVRLHTTVARRLAWSEPYFEVWWQAPVGMKQGSPFRDPGFGATATAKQQEAGVRFGFEAIAVDRGADRQRVSLDLSARIVGHFEGRNYSEMWEVFALAGNTQRGGPLILDRDPVMPGLQALSHPGITNIENYLELGGRAALRIDLGPLVRVAALAELTRETTHAITFADAGVDLPRCAMGQTPGPTCEAGNNDVVNPGTHEVNPVHVPLIDLVGHRYLSDGALNVRLGVEARVLF